MKLRVALIIFAVSCVSAAGKCSVPSLEPVECSQSQIALREFFSFHFGNDMRFSQSNLEKRQPYLTERFRESVEKSTEDSDPFTLRDNDFPKSFRIGQCNVESADSTKFDVLIFWKDDTRSEQRKLIATMKLAGDRWLLDGIDRAGN